MGMLFCLGIFLSFYLLTFLVACVENKRSVDRPTVVYSKYIISYTVI